MKQTPVYINGDGEQTRDFTFVENAVQVNVKGMLIDNAAALKQVYNVAVGENFSINYLYNLVQQGLNSNFKSSYRDPRAGDIRNSLADISLAQQLLAYQPTKKFEDGLIDTVEFFKQRYS
jgi:UDP-N-acetylglucosamine 4-epimerase